MKLKTRGKISGRKTNKEAVTDIARRRQAQVTTLFGTIEYDPKDDYKKQRRNAMTTHMRTTLILDVALLEKARSLSGLAETTAIVHAGLQALIAQQSARRLAALAGTDRRARAPRRR